MFGITLEGAPLLDRVPAGAFAMSREAFARDVAEEIIKELLLYCHAIRRVIGLNITQITNKK